MGVKVPEVWSGEGQIERFRAQHWSRALERSIDGEQKEKAMGEKVETFECIMVMVPLGVTAKLAALAEVEGVTLPAMAAKLLTEAGEDYYGKGTDD